MPSAQRLAAALITVACVLPTSAASRARIVVSTTSGRVAGKAKSGVTAFLGVAYAAPPTGARRWRPPEPPQRWRGVRAATRFGPSCWQEVSPAGFGPWTREYVVPGPVSEDCLSLNVWTPIPLTQARRAVLVWIHGGGFATGGSAAPVYDGRALARRGIVVVTINYRVGVYGFFAHQRLSVEAQSGPAANWGLQDVVAALRWVRSNIAAFGGDPRRVTIAGQSAGAVAVHALLAMPAARHLFRGAIVESGLPTDYPAASLPDAERSGEALADAMGANSIEQLRHVPAAQLARFAQALNLRFGPVVDGMLVRQHPAEPAARGAVADVPVLIGLNADEVTGFGGPTVVGTQPPNCGTWRNPEASVATTERMLARDCGLAALLGWARARVAKPGAPVFGYLFDHAEPGPQAARWGAFHSAEIPYVFGTLGANRARRFGAIDHRLSGLMGSYWVEFVKTGDPNGGKLPRWPPLRADDLRLMRFGRRVRADLLLSSRTQSSAAAYITAGGRLSLY